MSRTKYTKEMLQDAVSRSESVMGVMRLLGMRMAGGSHTHLSKKIKAYGLSTAHFTGAAHNKGKTARNKLTAQDLLTVNTSHTRRVPARQLRRALDDIGVPYCCANCGVSVWNDLPIVLHIHHKDGNYLNNRRDNLEYACPNCHSQTDTFCKKARVVEW
jgi:5-methylcytosine-specific restriction endonuclease McrA